MLAVSVYRSFSKKATEKRLGGEVRPSAGSVRSSSIEKRLDRVKSDVIGRFGVSHF